MAEEKAEKVVEEKKEEKNVVMALLCYLGLLIIIPLVTEAKKDPYVKFHIKQGIILLITSVVLWIASIILAFIPVLGWIIILLAWIGMFVLIIMGIVNSLTGKEDELPVVGKYADKIKI
jgi:uncharacterized membrane protein